jgi:hypothetical protein
VRHLIAAATGRPSPRADGAAPPTPPASEAPSALRS